MGGGGGGEGVKGRSFLIRLEFSWKWRVAHWVDKRILNGGTGICPFFCWENGILYTGTGIHQQKTIENGNGIKI